MTIMYITTYFRYIARVYIFPFAAGRTKFSWDWSWFIRIFRYGLAVYAASIFFLVSQRLPVLLIQALYGETYVAYFNAPLNLVNRLYLPVLALSNIIGPLFGRNDQSPMELGNLFEKSLRFIFVVFIPISVVFLLAAPQVINILYGAEFLPSASILQVFGVFILVSSISTFVSAVINFTGLAGKRVRYLVFVLAINIWLMVMGTQVWGYESISYILVISVAVLLLFDLKLIRKKVNFQYADVLAYLNRIILSVLPMIIALVGFRWYYSNHSGTLLFIALLLITGVIYLLGIFLTRVVSANELKEIRGAVKGIVKK
ncbi:oligosaccharide flippase family protein, partial [Candidatus Dojkabacteria bacterium]|nr:oligosaccharide flippase family protein [Candidatus Dojkabacteria bacterium]